VLGSPTQKAREDASAALLNYGFNFFETMPLQTGGQALLTPKVYKGAADSVAVGVAQNVSVTIPRGQGQTLSKETRIDGKLIAPLKAGQTVGEMTVKSGDTVVARVPLVTLAPVESGGFFGSMYDTVVLWFK
jgi:D-alanyl-D-alanine carboxypeptidase (penicillin-binding protein 5/6)